jgi:mono/diheme cytochrome c family protein
VIRRLRRRSRLALACGALVLAFGLGAPPGTPAADPIPSSNPLTGDLDSIKAGRKLYNTWCSQCHGPKADGVSRFGKYAADLRKFSQGYTEFARVVVEGRTEKRMPPWGEVLDGEQVSQVGAYLETLAIKGANWKDFE